MCSRGENVLEANGHICTLHYKYHFECDLMLCRYYLFVKP